LFWIWRFIPQNKTRNEIAEPEVSAFVSHIAATRKPANEMFSMLPAFMSERNKGSLLRLALWITLFTHAMASQEFDSRSVPVDNGRG